MIKTLRSYLSLHSRQSQLLSRQASLLEIQSEIVDRLGALVDQLLARSRGQAISKELQIEGFDNATTCGPIGTLAKEFNALGVSK